MVQSPLFSLCSLSTASLLNSSISSSNLVSSTTFISIAPLSIFHTHQGHLHQYRLQQHKKHRLLASSASYEVGGGFPNEEFDAQGRSGKNQQRGNQKLDSSQYEALLRGGEQVTSVLQEMIKLVSSTHCTSYLLYYYLCAFENSVAIFLDVWAWELMSIWHIFFPNEFIWNIGFSSIHLFSTLGY